MVVLVSHVNSFLITCKYLRHKFWIAVKPHFNFPAGINAILLIQLARYKFWRKSDASSDCLQNTLALPKWNSQHFDKFRDSNSSDFEDNFLPSLDPHFLQFCSTADVPRYFWTWKIARNLFSSHSLLSNSYFQHLKFFSSIFPEVRKNLMQTGCSSQTFSTYPRIANRTKHTHTLIE